MNILPSLVSRWTLANCTVDNLTFTFTAEGSASVTMLETDIKQLSKQANLSLVVSPEQAGYAQQISCLITVCVGTTQYVHTCILSNNSAGFYTTLLEFPEGAYDTFTVSFIAQQACMLYQASLDMVTVSIEETIAELRTELPKLLEDYNTYDISLTTEETTIGLITANLIENTDLQGHFSVSFIADTASEMVFRIYDDLRKCLYSPSIIAVAAGKYTIGFPHAYLKSKVGYHNFYVTMQATSGTVRIRTRSFMYTIDGAHVAVRLLDSFYKINDITAQTTGVSADPTMLYTVSVVDNIATIRHIEPNSVGTSNWSVDFTISNVKEAAIEFNGSWYTSTGHRLFITDALPVIVYIDTSNILWAQVLNSQTRTQLTTDVLRVCALRGWRFVDTIISTDVGFIVAYIKTDGKAYYKQYISNVDTPYWTGEEVIPFTSAVEPLVNISASRLNDYRIAFTVEDAVGDCYTILTKRYYQADAIENTTLNIADANIFLGWSEYINPIPVTVWNTSNTETFVRFSHALVSFDTKQAAFVLCDSLGVTKSVTATQKYDEYTIKLTHANIGGFAPGLSVVFTNSTTDKINGPLIVLHGTTQFAVQSFNFAFNAVDYSIKGYAEETVNTSSVNTNITLIPLVYTSGYTTDTINTSDANAVVTLTKITYKSGYNGTETANIASSNVIVTLTNVGTEPL